jgi:hypothetical protein
MITHRDEQHHEQLFMRLNLFRKENMLVDLTIIVEVRKQARMSIGGSCHKPINNFSPWQLSKTARKRNALVKQLMGAFRDKNSARTKLLWQRAVISSFKVSRQSFSLLLCSQNRFMERRAA